MATLKASFITPLSSGTSLDQEWRESGLSLRKHSQHLKLDILERRSQMQLFRDSMEGKYVFNCKSDGVTPTFAWTSLAHPLFAHYTKLKPTILGTLRST